MFGRATITLGIGSLSSFMKEHRGINNASFYSLEAIPSVLAYHSEVYYSEN